MSKIKTRKELIKAYKEHFKDRGHVEIPSASLIPENDPTVLFTSAGMHPLVPFFQGQKHLLGMRLVNVQKCIRTVDIDKIGNKTHLTFLEMLGNWSLGDYWKKEAIEYTYDFLIKVLGYDNEKFGVTVFGGDSRVKDISKDDESAEIWKSLGVDEKRIQYLRGGVYESVGNWWGPAGKTGPCGPDTEMFIWVGKEMPETINVEDKRWVEVGNNVLMQYNKIGEGQYEKLTQKSVDFGGGVERNLMVLNGVDDVYKTPSFVPLIMKIEELSGRKYGDNEEVAKAMRIVVDHVRAATFILGDVRGVKPSNLGQGYVLRRLIRRAVRYGRRLGIEGRFTKSIAELVILDYSDYVELRRNREFVFAQLDEEEGRFALTLEKGLRKFEELMDETRGDISGKDTFLLFQSYGFPIEMTIELAKERHRKVDVEDFSEELKKHQKLSRSSSSGTFKSGLADDSEATTKLHTATHLLNEALRRVLGREVKQRGSNINAERLRFDFNFSRKLTEDELKEIEDLINRKISEGLKIERDEMSLQEALDSGAQAEFGAKYQDIVSVYTILDSNDERGWFSKEICTGPHVKDTKEIGKFRIVKEQGVAAGVRRIRAVLG